MSSPNRKLGSNKDPLGDQAYEIAPPEVRAALDANTKVALKRAQERAQVTGIRPVPDTETKEQRAVRRALWDIEMAGITEGAGKWPKRYVVMCVIGVLAAVAWVITRLMNL